MESIHTGGSVWREDRRRDSLGTYHCNLRTEPNSEFELVCNKELTAPSIVIWRFSYLETDISWEHKKSKTNGIPNE